MDINLEDVLRNHDASDYQFQAHSVDAKTP